MACGIVWGHSLLACCTSPSLAFLSPHCLLLSAVADLTHPLAIAARNAVLRYVVALNGTLPNDWLWKYDCEAVVEADEADGAL